MLRIYNIQCAHSAISKFKERPHWFNKQKCFENLENVFDRQDIQVCYDGQQLPEYLGRGDAKRYSAGTGAQAMLTVIDMVVAANHHDDDILYFVEDDYIHLDKAPQILKEGIALNPDGYVSLYDHPDKYTDVYSGHTCQIFVSQGCHWRTAISTTNTFACKTSTFLHDTDIHRKWCRFGDIAVDHQKFLELGVNGRALITSIPGYATHVEKDMLSPRIDWENK